MKKALINGEIVTSFGTLENSAILIEDGKISNVGKISDISIPEGTEFIDCSNYMITTGSIDLFCDKGGWKMSGHDSEKGISDKKEMIDIGEDANILVMDSDSNLVLTFSQETDSQFIRV